MASVQDVLLMKAIEDSANTPSMQDAALLGGALGGAAGLAVGNDVHLAGLKANKMLGRPQPNRFMAGNRMAGGLVGLVLGGGLGVGARQMMIENSPAGTLLAKIQAGTFNKADQIALQQVLTDTYSQMGLT